MTVAAACMALLAIAASGVVAARADGTSTRSRIVQAKAAAQTTAGRALARSADGVPRAHGVHCRRTALVAGQGRSCRTGDGMYLVPQRSGDPVMTHGPDLVAAMTRSGRAGGFATSAAIVCSPPGSTRYVHLAYLVPADYADGAADVHGDRYAEVVPQLRQSLYDASALIDQRAGELVPGSRRRLRVLCDDEGLPVVDRVVLPRSASAYRTSGRGFELIMGDLTTLGWLQSYGAYASSHLRSVRRVLAYYDADYLAGYAGQGSFWRRSSLLTQGIHSSDPLVSRTTRNINNNPPSSSFAVQYGTRYAGVIDPPLYTSLLHELSHTMGAVQDELPTSSKAGHCSDGLDVMCYQDTPTTPYVETACPDAAPPYGPEDERYDCNGDTYFHPAPPAGNPLADATVWQLGLTANETLATTASGAPGVVTRIRVSGRGTRKVLRWPAVAGAVGYDVAYRRPGASWSYLSVTRPTAVPPLAPFASYELRVGAVGPGTVLGPRRASSTRTGVDTTPPSVPTSVALASATRSSVRLRFRVVADNVAVTRYRVERLSGRRWVVHRTLRAPRNAVARAGDVVTSPTIRGFRASGRYRLRLRALDARGNVSAPSRAILARTRR